MERLQGRFSNDTLSQQQAAYWRAADQGNAALVAGEERDKPRVEDCALATTGARPSGKMEDKAGKLPVLSTIARVRARIAACDFVML